MCRQLSIYNSIWHLLYIEYICLACHQFPHYAIWKLNLISTMFYEKLCKMYASCFFVVSIWTWIKPLA